MYATIEKPKCRKEEHWEKKRESEINTLIQYPMLLEGGAAVEWCPFSSFLTSAHTRVQQDTHAAHYRWGFKWFVLYAFHWAQPHPWLSHRLKYTATRIVFMARGLHRPDHLSDTKFTGFASNTHFYDCAWTCARVWVYGSAKLVPVVLRDSLSWKPLLTSLFTMAGRKRIQRIFN